MQDSRAWSLFMSLSVALISRVAIRPSASPQSVRWFVSAGTIGSFIPIARGGHQRRFQLAESSHGIALGKKPLNPTSAYVPQRKRSSARSFSKMSGGALEEVDSSNLETSAQSHSQANSPGTLAFLCDIAKRACDAMAPMIVAFYNSLDEEGTKTLKDDKSAFTIADGAVQHLLLHYLFQESNPTEDEDTGSSCNLRDIVGEEDDSVVVLNEGNPYTVDDLVIPDEFVPLVNEARNKIIDLRRELISSWNQDLYGDLTLFLDPIDGTREFASKKGQQCSICVGFANGKGQPVAGVVYRPIGNPKSTWAAGAASEGYAASELEMSPSLVKDGMLTTNGSMSPFMHEFIQNTLKYDRIKSGGAGNKMLMLLEGKGSAFITDRGVSRWDTCAAQACLEAHDGLLCKLSVFMNSEDGTEESYKYLASKTNLDFEPGVPTLTRYNCAKELDSNSVKGQTAETPSEVKPYANLCGLLALSSNANTVENKQFILKAAKAAAASISPSFN